MLYMVMSPWNIKASPFQESLKKWRGQTNTEWRKMYFYKAGDTILGSSHIKGWSKTWSCRSWSIKPCRATREKRECHVTFYPWCNPFQISYLIYHRRHSIWETELTKKNVYFCWKKCHQLEFDDLRNALHNNTLLTFFQQQQQQQPRFLYVDVHKTGLSATLLQGNTIANGKPVAFSSRFTMLV